METVAAIETDEISLPDPRLDPSRINIIRARRILVSGPVVLRAQHLAMYAREVIFQSGGSIDTSGGVAAQDFTGSSRINGGSPGANGRDGDSGSNGQGGGVIRIWAEIVTGPITLKTMGGNGGRGRDGGDGQQGANGNNAPGGIKSAGSNPGQVGQKGGDGGFAGVSGDGGKGGDIDLGIVDAKSFKNAQDLSKSLEGCCVGGKQGVRAVGGKGAPGGKGGAGGDFGHPAPLPPPVVHPMPVLFEEPKNDFSAVMPVTELASRQPQLVNDRPMIKDGTTPGAADGPVGADHINEFKDDKGNIPSHAPVDGANGTVKIRAITIDELSRATTSNHLSILVSTGERLYLSSHFSEAADVLGYAYRLGAKALPKS